MQSRSCTVPHSQHCSAWPRHKASVRGVQIEPRGWGHQGESGWNLHFPMLLSLIFFLASSSLCSWKHHGTLALVPPCCHSLNQRSGSDPPRVQDISAVNSLHFLTDIFPFSVLRLLVCYVQTWFSPSRLCSLKCFINKGILHS